MTKFIEARSKSTGKKQTIPERWLSLDFAPFNDFKITPSQKAKAEPKAAAEPKTTKEG